MSTSSTSSPPSLSSLATEAGTALSARTAGAGLSYVVQVLFARWAGPDHYGAYSYATAWAALLSTLCGLGLPQAILRYIPEYQSTEQWSYLKGVTQRSEQFVLGAGCLCAALGAMVVISFLPSAEDSLVRTPLLLGLALVPVLSVLQLQTQMCVARGQIRIAYILPRVVRPLLMIGSAAAIVIGFNVSLTAPIAILVAGAPVIPIWFTQRWAFRRHLPSAFKRATAANDWKNWLRTAPPMLLITGFILLLGKTDLLMIGILTDAANVGLYKVASKISLLVLFPMYAVNAIMAPRFAKQHASGQQDQLQRLASTAGRWILAGGLLIALGLSVTSGFLLGLFGPSFVEAESILFILVGGQLANVAAGAVAPLLTMTGHQNETAKIYGICALLNVLLNGAGIYFFGLHGAAAATTISTALWNAGLYRLVVQTLGIYPSALDLLTSSDAARD